MFRRHSNRLLFCIILGLAIIAFPLAALAATYIVQPSDSLWQISQRFHTTVNNLKSTNGLTGDTIYPGQQLNVPDNTAPDPGDYNGLKQQIQQYLAGQPGSYGVYFLDLTSGKSFGINETLPLPAASTAKLPAVLYVNNLVAQGKLSWQQKVTYHSYEYQGGSGILQFGIKEGDKFTLRSLTTQAITTSDNIAYNMIKDLVGKDNIINYMWNIGGKNVYPNGQNLSTAQDMATYLQAALDFARTNPDGARLLDDMANGIYNEGIPLYLPDNVRVAHKEGFVYGSPGDVGIVYGKRPFIITVLSQNVNDDVQGFNNIAAISKMAYDFQQNVK